MKFRDYYAALGVAPDASGETIKTAYRKLARTYHPDVNHSPGAEGRFKLINEANEALSDPQKRAAYDRLRGAGLREGEEFDPPPPGAEAFAGGRARRGASETAFGGFRSAGGSAGEAFGHSGDFSDFFQSLFGAGGMRGGAGRARRSTRGEDLHHRVAVTLPEAYAGGERELQLRVPDDAGGERTRTLRVKIPPGVTDGVHIRLRGQGLPGATADQAGDLYLEIALAEHPLFRVDGRDVHVELPVAPWEAALGASVSVPTLGGAVTMTIPAGAKAGERLRLRGRGLPGPPPGDQYLTLRVVTPPDPSPRAQELWRELAREAAFDPRAGLGS